MSIQITINFFTSTSYGYFVDTVRAILRMVPIDCVIIAKIICFIITSAMTLLTSTHHNYT
uniref:Uncharacterized protein n=1 Tax=Heterorhabditis bacteriophora TaxID=37862 RepID=A0A1I7XCS7_HETBA